MSELGLTPDETISVISQGIHSNYIYVAALCLVVYDLLLSFPQEIRSIWTRRYGIVTILYIFIRYGTILDIFMQMFNGFYIQKTAAGCKGVFIFTYVADIACKIAYAVFNCLRVFGITQSQWLPAMIVFTLSIFDPAINIYNYSNPVTYIIIPQGLLAGCWISPSIQEFVYLPVITRVVSVAADATILYFTLYVTWRTLKTALKSKSPFTLTSMLLINGSIQFGILLVLNVIAAILDLRSAIVTLGNSGQDASSFVAIQQILNSILLSHFILDLRSIYAIGSKPSDSSQSSYKTETVQFAAHIQSNLGASLDSSWATGEESTFEEVDKIQYSDNPLVTGLLESTRGCETSIKTLQTGDCLSPTSIDVEENHELQQIG